MPEQSFLDKLDPEARAALESLLKTRRYGRDEIVLTQDEQSTEIFFVLHGIARATVFSQDGKIVSFRDIAAGSVFGELSAIDDAPRSASIVAQEELRVGSVSRAEFRALVETNASVMWVLLEHLTEQCRRMTARIFEFSTMPGRARLVHELIRQAEMAGFADGEARLTPAPTHFDLATLISTHREAVSREMSMLSQLELISKKAGTLILHDLDSLRALANPE